MTLWIVEKEPTELKGNFSEEDLNTVIRAAYKQVLGNAHLMESQRNYSAESQLRHGNINVKGFISAIAKSQLYRDLFFEPVSQYRFIELNCKHLLGRAPKDQTEISYHVQVYQELGYDAEIDSYLQSEEYNQNFGENIVPYCRSSSASGLKNVNFNRTFALAGSNSSSDVANKNAKLIQDLATNLATTLTAPYKGSGTPSNRIKRFRIVARGAGTTMQNKRSNVTYKINYAQMNKTIQYIHRQGGQILSITEIA